MQDSNRQAEFVEFDWGAERFLRDGTTLPAGAVEMFQRDFDAILFGAVGDPRVPSNRHAADILLGLRAKLDLYVNARPVELLDASLTPLRDRAEDDIRFIIFRENTEGLYAGAGGQFRRGSSEEIAIQEDINTRRGVERIIRYAFEYARARNLGKVLMSDKSNALTFGHELWQRVFAELRGGYPEDPGAPSLYRYTGCGIGARSKAVSRDRYLQSSWRYRQRSSGAIGGRIGHRSVGKYSSGTCVAFRAGARFCSEYRGEGHRQSHGRSARFRDALRSYRLGDLGDLLRAAVRAAVRAGQTTRDLGGPHSTREVGDWLLEYVAKENAGRERSFASLRMTANGVSTLGAVSAPKNLSERVLAAPPVC